LRRDQLQQAEDGYRCGCIQGDSDRTEERSAITHRRRDRAARGRSSPSGPEEATQLGRLWEPAIEGIDRKELYEAPSRCHLFARGQGGPISGSTNGIQLFDQRG